VAVSLALVPSAGGSNLTSAQACTRGKRGVTTFRAAAMATLIGILGVAPSHASSEEAGAAPLPRIGYDRADDLTGSQVHVMYVLPSDGVDRHLDSNGMLGGSLTAFQTWLQAQSSGRSLRIDTYQGSVDLTFFRLSRTDSEIAGHLAFAREQIEADLKAAGFNAPNKIYAIYYDGTSAYSCGGGAWPPDVIGSVAALYLLGEPPGFPPCSTNTFASAAGPPRYFEFAMLHEIVHTLGFVATCAPHHTRRGHVSDAPHDLMWAGEDPWDIEHMELDVGRDDYFAHSTPSCPNLQDSPFMTSEASPPGQTIPPPPAPPTTPQPTQLQPQPKSVTLKAKPKKIERGGRTKLTAVVSPCPGHEGGIVEFYRGSKRLAQKPSNAACMAVLRVRIWRTTTFKALSPQQDADHLAGVSNRVRVRVTA
jgi:hypothetical protein